MCWPPKQLSNANVDLFYVSVLGFLSRSAGPKARFPNQSHTHHLQ